MKFLAATYAPKDIRDAFGRLRVDLGQKRGYFGEILLKSPPNAVDTREKTIAYLSPNDTLSAQSNIFCGAYVNLQTFEHVFTNFLRMIALIGELLGPNRGRSVAFFQKVDFSPLLCTWLHYQLLDFPLTKRGCLAAGTFVNGTMDV